MTPQDFAAFLALCKERHGWTFEQTGKALGISENMPKKYRTEGATIPRYVALACAAIAADLPPWPDHATGCLAK